MLIKPHFSLACFEGKKPTDISEYAHKLIQELDGLLQNGIILSKNEIEHQFPFNMPCIICDTPTRAFVKCCKGYSGYFGCDKCSQRGLWNEKLSFPETDAPQRTNASFGETSNIEQHLASSPFRVLPIGMVSQFPLDYTHLVCLGVMTRLMWLWLHCPLLIIAG